MLRLVALAGLAMTVAGSPAALAQNATFFTGPRSSVTTDRPRGASLDGSPQLGGSRKRGPGLEMMSL